MKVLSKKQRILFSDILLSCTTTHDTMTHDIKWQEKAGNDTVKLRITATYHRYYRVHTKRYKKEIKEYEKISGKKSWNHEYWKA